MLVDENLFYKGVDKRTVHESRLNQSHSFTDPTDLSTAFISQQDTPQSSLDTESGGHPPYPFSSGDSLLALTKKHNVRTNATLLGPL